MRIVNQIMLEGNITALALERWPTFQEKAEFDVWAKKCKVNRYATLEMFYIPDLFGDTDYPAIQVKSNAPNSVITLCLLRWNGQNE